MANIPPGFYYGGAFLAFIIFIVAVVKSRYRKFTNREFVLFFRNGKLKAQGYGGGYFLLPLIDEIIILSTTVQRLEVDVAEKIITKENQDLRVSGFIIYRIEDPVKAYQAISGTQDRSVLTELNRTLEDLVESIIRTTVASLSLDQVLRERSLIIEAIMSEMVPVVSPMGIQISTSEIRHVEVLDQHLFEDLQEDYRQEARLRAEKTKIETEREVAKSRAVSDEDIKSRELQRDQAVLIEQQKLEEAQEKRMIAVESLQMEREAKIADLTKKKLEIEAQTKLMEIEFEAESNKRRQLLEQVDIQAETKKRMAEADAEAIRMAAYARKEAVELDAEAEATKLRTVAEAMKESLLAEAEGRKALLLAEAEGLREKVKAQGYVNESMIMQELVKQLPNIASSMKVGDINWLNMGGGNGNGDTPLGIIPKNLTQIMALSKSFGLDIEDLLRTIRGQPKTGTNGAIEAIAASQDNESGEASGPVVYTHEQLTDAKAVYDAEGELLGFDVDGDDDVDFTMPAGLNLIIDDEGHIEGFDLSGSGSADYSIDTFQNLAAIDQTGDGMIDGLSLDGRADIDINLKDLALMI